MAYFELKADFALNPEITSVRKNDVYRLERIALMIQRGDAPDGLMCFLNKKQVAASDYAAEVIRLIGEHDKKFKETHKRIWIQHGVCGNSGYYKWIKAA
jgi:hypothetical protein